MSAKLSDPSHQHKEFECKALLGFHLKCKHVPHDESEFIVVDQAVAQHVDSNFPVARHYWPKTDAASELFGKWNNEVM